MLEYCFSKITFEDMKLKIEFYHWEAKIFDIELYCKITTVQQ